MPSSAKSDSKPRGTYLARVLANDKICREHYRIVLGLDSFPPSKPGQFVQVQCSRVGLSDGAKTVEFDGGLIPKFTQRELTDSESLLRRPLSIAGRREGENMVELEIIYRTVGVGTRWLANIEPPRTVSIIGPLGNNMPISDDKPRAALVGGGVGIPPMLYLAEALAQAGKRTVAFSGVRSRDLLPLKLLDSQSVRTDGMPVRCIAEFDACGAESAVATDDGSLGFDGLVGECFERWLSLQDDPQSNLVVYSCGPEAMMKAIGQACIGRGIECYLSLERHMGCGMGTCQSCVCKIKTKNDQGWAYKLCCTDGPVFDAQQIVWEH